jgi:hypothetical protein
VLTAIRSSFPFLVAIVACLVFTPTMAGCQATTPTAASASSAISLQPYTIPDGSASAGVPSGWQVTSSARTFILMKGPQGEIVSLGAITVARNAAFQPAFSPANGIDISMPYAAPLPQKLAMVLQHASTMSGKSFNQFAITSATPIKLPATLGQCGRFVGGFSNQDGPLKIMGVFCSLPLDTGGTYKNIWLMAQAPAAVAAQSAPTAQAIFGSYRVPPTWLRAMLAPHTAAPVVPVRPVVPGSAAMINGSTALGAAGIDHSVDCFDQGVLRQTPAYKMPPGC